jgi:hypothetical protein
MARVLVMDETGFLKKETWWACNDHISRSV